MLIDLIQKFTEAFEVTVIAAIKAENEIKNVLYNTVRELLITLKETRLKSWNGDFILKMKDQITKPKIEN